MAIIVEATATFAFLFLIFGWFITRSRYSKMKWPVLGIHDYGSDLLNRFQHSFRIKGPWFSKVNFIATSDPENIHYVFSRKFTNFNKGPTFKEIFEVLGDGILATESDSWKIQRKLIHSLFRQNNFSKLVETTSQRKVEMGLFKILDHAFDNVLEVDMQDLFLRFTLDVTCIFLLGSDLNSLSMDLPEIPFAKALDDAVESLLHRHLKPKSLWKFQKWLHFGLEKKATKAIKIIDSFIYQQVSLKQEQNYKSRAKGEAAGEEGFDLISNFIMDEVAAKCQSLEKPLETFLRDSVMNILFAGRDTAQLLQLSVGSSGLSPRIH